MLSIYQDPGTRSHRLIEQTLLNAEPLFSARTGIIKERYDNLNVTGFPEIFFCTTVLTDTARLSGSPVPRYNGGGAFCVQSAKAKAVKKAVKRYCLGMHDPSGIFFDRYDPCDDRFIHPDRFVLFDETQYRQPGFNFKKFDPDKTLGWYPGTCLANNRQVYIPACFVFSPYCFTTQDQPIACPNETGTAADVTLADAVCQGFYDVIEKDHFMIVWHNRLCMPTIDLSSDLSGAGDKIRRAVETFDFAHLDITVKNISLDTQIPVILCIGKPRCSSKLCCSFGLGTDFDPETAIVKALESLAVNCYRLRACTRCRGRSLIKEYDIDDPVCNPSLYQSDDIKTSIAFLLEHDCVQGVSDLKKTDAKSGQELMDMCTDICKAIGRDLIIAQITTPDIQDAGFRVVKVIVPGMQPLDLSCGNRYLASMRLSNVPVDCEIINEHTPQDTCNPHACPDLFM